MDEPDWVGAVVSVNGQHFVLIYVGVENKWWAALGRATQRICTWPEILKLGTPVPAALPLPRLTAEQIRELPSGSRISFGTIPLSDDEGCRDDFARHVENGIVCYLISRGDGA